MEIDIRKDLEFQADVIRYAGEGILQIYKGDYFVSYSEDSNADAVEIYSKEDAENLIKALEKAISLGWWK
ncbi:hypothetical protein [Pseudomonas sp.]|uniref:hypothetical protein n=1 Tax=Pseudomonas sp. TaxID=306 RepID=UPI003FD803C5